MKLNECYCVIENFLQHKGAYYGIHKNQQEKLWKSLHMIKNHISLMEKEEQVPDFPISVVFTPLTFLRGYVLDYALDDNVRTFLQAYCELVRNWNENLSQNEDISKEVRTIMKLIDMQLTMNESMSILRNLNKRMRELLNWNPPSFELSRHYQKFLDGEGE